MTGYLFDTNHVSAVFQSRLNLITHPKSTADAEFGVGLPSVGELAYMVFNSARVSANMTRLDVVLRDFILWDFDVAAALEFGRVKTELRGIGRPIPDVDAQIAAIARVRNLVLLTDDAHFAAVQGLRVDNWLR